MSAKSIIISLIVALFVVSSVRAQSDGPATVEKYQPSELDQRISEAFRKGECDNGFALLERYQGDPFEVAFFVIARFHETGLCPPKDPEKTFAEMEEAAEKWTFIPDYFLGFMHLNGIGTPKDPGKASYWFKKNALTLAGFLDKDRLPYLEFPFGKHRIPAVLRDELAWVREVENGDPERLYDLALRLRDGEGLPRDCTVAEIWLRKAAMKKLAKAQYEYGKWLIDGVCVDINVSSGLNWIQDAAKTGYLEAQKYLGVRFASEEPSEVANIAAYYWLKRAQSADAGVERLLEQVEARITEDEKGLATTLLKYNYVPAFP